MEDKDELIRILCAQVKYQKILIENLRDQAECALEDATKLLSFFVEEDS